jgi:DNA-binding transcriptional ArsR family regulator
MDHMDVFIQYRYGHIFCPILSRKEFLKLISVEFTFPFTEKNIDGFFSKLNKPKTAAIVHALAKRGVQPKTIATWLDISKSTVSVHLANKEGFVYINPDLQRIRYNKDYHLQLQRGMPEDEI